MLEHLDSFGWDYAESSDGTGDMFMYWDHLNGDPPGWADWVSSCETIEDVFKAYWDSLYPGRWKRNTWYFEYKLKAKETK